MTTLLRDLGICSFVPCGDPVTDVKHHLCIGHYKQWRTGKPLRVKRGTAKRIQGGVCEYPTCERQSEYRYGALCSAHGRQRDKGHPLYSVRGDACDHCDDAPAWTYGACVADARRARNGEIDVFGIPRDKTCDSKGCEVLVGGEARYCPSHTMRRIRGMDIDAPLSKRRTAPDRACPVVGCDNLAETRTGMEYCSRHASTFRRTGGTALTRTRNNQYTGRECFVTGCTEAHLTHGMCAKHHTRASNYGLTVIQYDALVTGASCRICGATGKLHIDHDHRCCSGERSCGRCVRGMLCRACNHGLGNFKDSRAALLSAIAYLDEMDMAA